ncbi:hypothetical protein NKDENANG_02823 [Candidatus Entotheonellaceae bacterium PAL068K]
MTTLAQQTGLNRETLYRTLSEKGNPELASRTVFTDILHARSDSMRVLPMICGWLLLCCLSGCKTLADIDITIVGTRSALENQILGTYKELNNEMLLLASVRSIDANGRLVDQPPLSDDKRQALAALQSRAFNKDDIERFKAAGWAGENREGLLTYFPDATLASDPRQSAFVQEIIAEDNRDRLILMHRIMATHEQFTERDLPKVQQIFAALNRDNAKPGERIEQADGAWIRK